MWHHTTIRGIVCNLTYTGVLRCGESRSQELPHLQIIEPELFEAAQRIRAARRPDCVTEIRMGDSVLVVSGYFKKDTTTTAADKIARVLEAEAAATQEPTYPA